MASFLEKLKKSIKRPKLVRVKIYDFLFGRIGLFQKKYQWSSLSRDVGHKVYKDYNEYISHQKAKLSTMDLSDYDEKYYKILRERLAPLAEKNIVREGRVALCLAARIGTEVRAFKDLNCFAVGIDLNPGKDNKYVLPGDFHDIQFPQNSVDIIFTNSLDHSLYLDKLVKEIKRVLKWEGHVVLEIVRGVDEGGKAGYYEAVAWSKVDDCLEFFINNGFKIVERNPFEYPWGGEQVILKIND